MTNVNRSSDSLPLNIRAMQLAATQHGVIATRQLRPYGTRSAIRHELLNTGRWQRQHTGVFLSTAWPLTDHSAVMAAVLDAGPGASAARSTAAALWDLPGFKLQPVHVVRPKSTNSTTRRGLYVRHESRNLPGQDITVVEGLPTTAPPRTLVDLGERMHPDRLERLLDRSWSNGLLSYQSVWQCCERLGVAGRPAVETLLALIDVRGEEWVPPASGLESRLNQLMVNDGLGGIERQVNIGGEVFLGRTDFLHRSGVLVEAQSEKHHTSLTDREADRRRNEAIAKEGWDVVEVWDHEIWHRPDQAIARIRQAISARQART